jgi:hypothetical protein
VAERIVDNVEAWASPQRNDVALNVRGDVAHRHDRAKRRESVGQRIAVGEHLGTRARANAVGADEHCALEAAAIFGFHTDAVAAFVEARHHRVADECDQIIAPAGIEQHVMKVDAVNDDVGIFEAGAEFWDAGWYPSDLTAVEGIDHQDSRRRIGFFEHGGAHAYAVQCIKDIGAELDAVAYGAEFRRAFKHAHREAVAR